MTHEFMIGGIMVSTIVPAVLAALILTVLLSRILVPLGFYRIVWRRPLVELAIFCILLGVIVTFVPDGAAID